MKAKKNSTLSQVHRLSLNLKAFLKAIETAVEVYERKIIMRVACQCSMLVQLNRCKNIALGNALNTFFFRRVLPHNDDLMTKTRENLI